MKIISNLKITQNFDNLLFYIIKLEKIFIIVIIYLVIIFK